MLSKYRNTMTYCGIVSKMCHFLVGVIVKMNKFIVPYTSVVIWNHIRTHTVLYVGQCMFYMNEEGV